MRFAANISLMYGHAEFRRRLQLAVDDGFEAVECWWPFPDPSPSDGDVEAFLASLGEHGLVLAAMNLYAGNMAAGDRGILSHGAEDAAFARSVEVISTVARETGCRTFNALYGQRLPRVPDDEHAEIAVDRLRDAARTLAPLGAALVVEPLTRGENGDYPLATLEDALHIVDAVADPAVGILFDVYHLTNNGVDVVNAFADCIDRVGHIQIADSPGRGRPGTGTIDFAAFYRAVERSGYDGWIGCEYRTTELAGVPTLESISA